MNPYGDVVLGLDPTALYIASAVQASVAMLVVAGTVWGLSRLARYALLRA